MAVKTYCNYGLYDEENAYSLEEGEYCDKFTYWNNGKQVTLNDITINNICKDRVVVELEDGEKITIQVDDIIGWE